RIQRSENTAGELQASSPGELSGLKALFAEYRAALRRLERHGRFLAAIRAVGDGFHPFARRQCAGRSAGPLAFAGLAPLRLVFEVLIGEELLFSRRPHELRAAVYAP